MKKQRLKKFIERLLAEEPPEEYTFTRIQNDAIISNSSPEMGQLIVDHELLYRVLVDLQDVYPIELFTPGILGYTKLIETSKRESEVLGKAMLDLEVFRQMARDGMTAGFYSVERGYIFLADIKNTLYIVKAIQGENEIMVARKASDLLVGPKIADTGKVWIAEEFINGSYPNEKVPETLGYVCGTLHRNGIVYNDSFRRHLKLAKRGPVMIDYGVSKLSTCFDRDFEILEKEMSGVTSSKEFMAEYDAAMVR